MGNTFFILFSTLAGIIAVYFTKSVIFIKEELTVFNNKLLKVIFGAFLVGTLVYFFPGLYGDSYHAISPFISSTSQLNLGLDTMIQLSFLILLKPLAASFTLGAGGDGGVFAPSIVTGALLGILISMVLNYSFNIDLIVVNFAVIGAAAMLSAAIHAPLTALFLGCSIVGEGYVLFIPIFLAVFIAKISAQLLCDYNVYTYRRKKGPFYSE